MIGYQRVWYAKSKYFLGGNIVTGPLESIAANIFDFAVLIIVFIDLTYAYVVLWDEGYHIPIMIGYVLLIIFTVNLFFTAYTDPGVLLRPARYLSLKETEDAKKAQVVNQRLEELKENNKEKRAQLEQKYKDEGMQQIFIDDRLRNFDKICRVDENFTRIKDDYEEELKKEQRILEHPQNLTRPHIFTKRWGETCMIWRPEGASHCPVCDHCVHGWDHHGVITNSCVGARNIRNFTYILITSSVLAYLTTYLNHQYYMYAIKNVIDKEHYEIYEQK